MRSFLLIIIFILFYFTSCEKNNVVSSKNNSNTVGPTLEYLGQNPPGMTPVIFARVIISIVGNQYRESDLNFRPDGQKCIFSRFGPNIPDWTIYKCEVENNEWTEPSPTFIIGDGEAFEPGLSPDGQKLFFSPPGIMSHGTQYIYSIEQDLNGWINPTKLFQGIYPSITNDGTVYYTTFFNGKDHIAFRECVNGTYQQENIGGANIYSQFEDAHPFISPDEDYLIFDSEDRPNINDYPLFVSFKKQEGSWSGSIYMGNQLGISNASLARVTPDGKYLFFKSEGDIYWVDSKIIENLKPENQTRNQL
jgi:Tol biopolymer transport system component